MEKNGVSRQINLAVDCVVFGFDEDQLSIILTRRSNPYFEDKWALPGSMIFPNEGLEEASQRTLTELTGLEDIFMDQVHTFGDPYRAGYGSRRIVTVTYMAIIDKSRYQLSPVIKNRAFISNPDESEEIKDVRWVKLHEIPELPQDHSTILFHAVSKLRHRFRYEPLGKELLPDKFTLRELQGLYEAIYETKLDPGNFRKKILKLGHLEQLDEKQDNVSHRKARYYRFNEELYQDLLDQGIYLDFAPKKELIS